MIRSERQRQALEYALRVIQESPVFQYVTGVYLFGSCARQSETWDSDVDILIELDPTFNSKPELRIPLRLLKTEVMTDDLSDPEVDLKIVVGNDWQRSSMLFYKNVRREGIRCGFENIF